MKKSLLFFSLFVMCTSKISANPAPVFVAPDGKTCAVLYRTNGKVEFYNDLHSPSSPGYKDWIESKPLLLTGAFAFYARTGQFSADSKTFTVFGYDGQECSIELS